MCSINIFLIKIYWFWEKYLTFLQCFQKICNFYVFLLFVPSMASNRLEMNERIHLKCNFIQLFPYLPVYIHFFSKSIQWSHLNSFAYINVISAVRCRPYQRFLILSYQQPNSTCKKSCMISHEPFWAECVSTTYDQFHMLILPYDN